MTSFARYEIVDTLASGDFATVYRARDRELGREVAVKQIHQQFLHDERQLARFWQEAQLLASLQHPHIVTIYDIVRSRGWLILELMRGTLKHYTEAEPIDLDSLRAALAGALSALHFLHANGVIHGDVKPSNLMVDSQHRVKLGDFGLARRAASEEGSLLKGTTKYMAPELVSNQFGAVGPASDLYSLGFSAYELLCGAQFESLFPTLNSFGRDRQIAWMMWHAAADRHLPEIGRVLQGVPDDLAQVIQRMVVKDQVRRYHSAADVLRDLRTNAHQAPVPEELPPQLDPALNQRAKRRRILTMAGTFLLVLAAVVGIAIFLMPEPPKVVKKQPPAVRGMVRNVYVDERKFIIEDSDKGKPYEVHFQTRDSILINDKAQLLRDLQPGDHVLIKTEFDEHRFPMKRIFASRPVTNEGTIEAVKAETGELKVKVPGPGANQSTALLLNVSNDVRIKFNGSDVPDGKPVKLADLRPDDRIVVQHIGDELGRGDSGQRNATAISVERVVSFEGVLRNVDARKRQMTVGKAVGEKEELVVLPCAEPCEVTLNERRFLNQKVLKPADLKPGDKVRVAHDVKIVRIDAYRILGQAGTIQKIEYNVRLLELQMEGAASPLNVVAPPTCQITLAGEPAQFEELRVGDQVDVLHDTPDAKAPPVAKTIDARRPPDPTRWAVLIANQAFDDITVTKPPCAAADAKLLHDVLVKRHKVPEEQILQLIDESQVRLDQGIPAFLSRMSSDAALLVYVSGQAYKDTDGKIYLAPKGFSLAKMSSTGIPLQWLLDQLEACKAGAKLWLVDLANGTSAAERARQPSSAEMILALQGPPSMPALRTVTVIASCGPGQHGEVLPDKSNSLFAAALASAHSGKADKNRDMRLEPTELSEYLVATMASTAGQAKVAQTPVLYLPDTKKPRLTEDAKKALRRLASLLQAVKVDVTAAKKQYPEVEPLCGVESEPKLLYGLLMLKGKQRDDAVRTFNELTVEYPKDVLPVQAIAWLQFERLAMQSGVERLNELVGRIPGPESPTEPLPPEMQRLFFWIGQLREFAVKAAQEGRRASESSAATLDAAVAQHGSEAARYYEQGRAKTIAKIAEYDASLKSSQDDASTARLKIERRQLPNYVVFPYDDAMQAVLGRLDK
jgi:eukaryotic-like serine/threonine-protein kinase